MGIFALAVILLERFSKSRVPYIVTGAVALLHAVVFFVLRQLSLTMIYNGRSTIGAYVSMLTYTTPVLTLCESLAVFCLFRAIGQPRRALPLILAVALPIAISFTTSLIVTLFLSNASVIVYIDHNSFGAARLHQALGDLLSGLSAGAAGYFAIHWSQYFRFSRPGAAENSAQPKPDRYQYLDEYKRRLKEEQKDV